MTNNLCSKLHISEVSPELDTLRDGQGDQVHISISSNTEMDLDSDGETSNCRSTHHKSSSPEIVSQRVLSLRERARLQLNHCKFSKRQ